MERHTCIHLSLWVLSSSQVGDEWGARLLRGGKYHPSPPERNPCILYIHTPIFYTVTHKLRVGVEEPMKRLQPCLYQFIRGRLLKGEEPTPDRKKEAVTQFLSPFISSITSTMVQGISEQSHCVILAVWAVG